VDGRGTRFYQNAHSLLERLAAPGDLHVMTLSNPQHPGESQPITGLSVGMVLFDGLTQLDLTGPYEVLARMPHTRVHLIAASGDAVRSEWGLRITPDASFDDTPELDVLCVPGGWGVNAQLENESLLDFLRMRAEHARYVCSVCSGSLLLGAAGLLRGYRATTHWMSLDLLPLFGAEAVTDRVVRDRNRITGAGVTAGIDFGLVLAAELFDPAVAQGIQLAVEYQPVPPFDGGTPHTASDDVRASVLLASMQSLEERRAIVERAAARLHR
jgi:cyclohexyl-isocyanide hydratase